MAFPQPCWLWPSTAGSNGPGHRLQLWRGHTGTARSQLEPVYQQRLFPVPDSLKGCRSGSTRDPKDTRAIEDLSMTMWLLAGCCHDKWVRRERCVTEQDLQRGRVVHCSTAPKESVLKLTVATQWSRLLYQFACKHNTGAHSGLRAGHLPWLCPLTQHGVDTICEYRAGGGEVLVA